MAVPLIAASRRAARASLAPSACANRRSSSDSAGGAPCRAMWLAPYGVPPLRVVIRSASVYGIPTISMPWCNSGNIMDSSVASWPPCKLLVEQNRAAGLPASSPDSQSPDVESKKCFSGAAMLPKRVGDPTARPPQDSRSASSA